MRLLAILTVVTAAWGCGLTSEPGTSQLAESATAEPAELPDLAGLAKIYNASVIMPDPGSVPTTLPEGGLGPEALMPSLQFNHRSCAARQFSATALQQHGVNMVVVNEALTVDCFGPMVEHDYQILIEGTDNSLPFVIMNPVPQHIPQ